MKQLKIFTRPERLTWKGALASAGALVLTCSGGALAWQANGWSVYMPPVLSKQLRLPVPVMI